MMLSKRLFDVSIGILLFIALLPLLVTVGLFVLILEGRPILYKSKRMKSVTQDFTLLKFRTMKTTKGQNTGVSGGDKSNRITKTGAFLRRSRLDELPQILNVIRGDISFVGPRPPLRLYVEKFPVLYGRVLLSRPGITGLASLHFHQHESWILEKCSDPEETDAVYCRRCIPRKAKIDLIYQDKGSLCFDMEIMWRTVASKFRSRKGRNYIQ